MRTHSLSRFIVALCLAIPSMACGAAPSISSVSPSSGKQNQTLTVTIYGSGFTGATDVSFGAGITVNSKNVDSDTKITANMTIALDASVGTRDVTVTKPDFLPGTKYAAFTVDSGSVKVTSVIPSAGKQGQSMVVAIYGENFTGATDVSFGAGITVNSRNVDSDTKITVNITIAVDASIGSRDVTVTIPDFGPGTKPNCFSVQLGARSLTISSTTGGQVTSPGEGRFEYPAVTSVAIVASADTNYQFLNWTGTAVTAEKVVDPTMASTSVTVDAEYTLRANFGADRYTLSITSGDGGSVTVPGEGDFQYNHGQVVTVVATPDAECQFTTWTGTAVDAGKVANPTSASTTVTTDADYTLVADFTCGQPKPPEVSTWEATDVSATSATLHGHLVDDGGSACQGRFRYGLEGSEESTTDWAHIVEGQTFSWSLEKLIPDSTYRFAAESRNDTGMSQAEWQSFKTPPLAAIHVDDDAAGEPNEDGTEAHPYDSIQEAIDSAGLGALVLVHEGVYPECLDLADKDITVRGLWLTDPNVAQMPVVDGNGLSPVVTFAGRGGAGCTLDGLLITGGKGDGSAAISCVGADPVIAHCVIGGNTASGAAGSVLSFEDSNAVMVHCTITGNLGDSDSSLMAVTDCNVAVSNCILWDNTPATIRTVSGSVPGITYSDVQGGWPGMDNLSPDPLFADPGVWSNAGTPADPSDDVWVPADCHLLSTKGRFWPDFSWWFPDKKTSPCIDAGDPVAPVGDEPTPNGDRVNLGAYGGTSQASLSK